MRKILIIQTRPGIGDLCIFLPLIKIISKIEDSSVDLLTKERTQAKHLLKYEATIKNIYFMPNRKINIFNFFFLFNLLNSKSYDKVYIFHFGLVYFILKKIFINKKIFFYGLKKIKVRIFQYAKEKVSLWCNNKKNVDYSNFLNLDNRWPVLNNSQKKIVIGIGGSGPNKKWDIDNYIQIIKKISQKNEYLFVIAGGKEEQKDYIKLENELDGIKILNLCNETIDTCIKNIKGSQFCLTNDTSFMHIASFLDIKTFGIFGGTPSDYSTYNPKIIPITPEGINNVVYDDGSMNKIDVDHVLKILNKNLKW